MEFTSEETRRIHALHEYKILDTERETSYEDLTYLAAKLYQAPMAAIVLVDKDRQWFKSARGILEAPPLETSICAYVVKTKKSLLLADASKDPHFQNYDIVRGPPHVRFYAGVPLITPEGHVVGTLTVGDTRPKKEGEFNLQDLEALARQVMDHLEHRRADKISKVTSSIANDINNPLAIINGTVELLRRVVVSENPEAKKSRGYLESIEKNVFRIDKILREL